MLSLFELIDKAFRGGSKPYKTNIDTDKTGETANAIKDMNKAGRRKQSFFGFGGTASYNNTGNRTDRTAQAAIQQDIAKGRKIEMESPQSSRYQLRTRDSKALGLSKNQAMFTSDDLADLSRNGNLKDNTVEKSVASTAVKSFAYNPKTQDLDIDYVNGSKTYNFPGVPPEVVTEFMDAPSKGKYLFYEIKPKFSAKK